MSVCPKSNDHETISVGTPLGTHTNSIIPAMETAMQQIETLGLSLACPPAPVANYVPAMICGNTLITSGQIPLKDGQLLYKGAVPSCQSMEDAVSAAKQCGLNALAVAAAALDGDINRIKRVLQLRVFIAADAGFEGHSTVADGASHLMVEVFGEHGKHTRIAVGSSGLPLGATVEVEAMFELHEPVSA